MEDNARPATLQQRVGDNESNQRQQFGHQGGMGRQHYRDNVSETMLRRQREERGPYMIVFNIPEGQHGTPDEQRSKDLSDVRNMMLYIEDDDFRIDNKVVGVTRLGKKENGKCRPIRVQFVGQMYRDVAVSLGFRIRYSNWDEVNNKAVMCKDLCREDREKAKIKYDLKKQQRAEAGNQNNGSTGAVNRVQVPPQNINNDRQGAGERRVASPRMGNQHRVP